MFSSRGSSSNSQGLFILTHESRHVAVLRDKCRTYEGILNLIQSTFVAARLARAEDIVIQATLPGYPTWKIELSRATWDIAFPNVNDVTITINSRDMT